MIAPGKVHGLSAWPHAEAEGAGEGPAGGERDQASYRVREEAGDPVATLELAGDQGWRRPAPDRACVWGGRVPFPGPPELYPSLVRAHEGSPPLLFCGTSG